VRVHPVMDDLLQGSGRVRDYDGSAHVKRIGPPPSPVCSWRSVGRPQT